MATQSDGRLTDAQNELCRDFLDRALLRLGENLELLLGLDPGLSVESLGVESDAKTRAALFPNAIAFPLHLAGATRDAIHLVVEPVVARAMLGLSRLASEEELSKLRERVTPLTVDDRRGLREVAEFIAAAFTEEARAKNVGSVTFEATQPLILQESQWESGHDPISAKRHLVVRGDLELLDDARDAYVLIVPWDLLGEIVDGLAEAENPPSQPLAATALERNAQKGTAEQHATGSSDFAPTSSPPAAFVMTQKSGRAAMLSLLPDAQCFERPSALLAALEDGETPDLLVVRVAPGEEHLLPLVASLGHHPAVARVQILVILEEPTRRVVLRCGELGLLNVLPADAPPALAAARVRALRGF